MASLAKTLFDEAVANAGKYAKLQRAAQLNRSYYRQFDSRGVHLFSYEIGRAQALIDVDEDLRGVVLDPDVVKNEAFDAADRVFIDAGTFT